MDYLQQLAVIRDNMHRELVQEATVRTFMKENSTDGFIELSRPFMFCKEDYHPLKGNYTYDCFVIGIHCASGDLMGEDAEGCQRCINYRDLSIEEMVKLHEYVVQQKQFKFTLYDEKN